MTRRSAEGRAKTLIYRLEVAATEMAFIGTIPVFSDDPDEQRAINAERRRLNTNLTRARNALLRALTEGDDTE